MDNNQYNYSTSWQPSDQSGAQSWELHANSQPLAQPPSNNHGPTYYAQNTPSQNLGTFNSPGQNFGVLNSSVQAPTAPAASSQTGWQQQAGWHKGGSMLSFGASPDHQPPTQYVSSQQSYGSAGFEGRFQDADRNLGYRSENQKAVSEPKPSFSFKNLGSSSRPPQVPQAEVFRMANQQIMSRMKGPINRHKGPWQKKGNANTTKNVSSPGPSYTPTQLLNQKGLTGISWESKSFPASEGPRVVHVSILRYKGAQYNGIGRTKDDSMNDAAKYFLKGQGDNVPHYEEENAAGGVAVTELHQLLVAKKCSKMEFVFSLQGPPFECSADFAGFTFYASGSSKKTAKAAVAARVLDSVNTGQIEVPEGMEKMEVEKNLTSTAVGELTRKVAGVTTLEWHVDSVKANATSAVMHTAHLTICGQQFSAQDISKKRAKNAVAQQVLQAVESQSLVLPAPKPKAVKRSASAMEDNTDEPDAKRPAEGLMHPISKVNQMFPGNTVTWTYETAGPPHQPQFTCRAFIQSKFFSAVAGNKKEAKLLTCAEVIKAVEAGQIEPVKRAEPKPRKERPPKKEPMDAETTKDVPQPAPAASADTEMVEKQVENRVSKVIRLFGKLEFEVQNMGVAHEPMFVMRAMIGERAFTGSGPNKKEAKQACCQTILDALEAGEIQPPVKQAVQMNSPSTGKVGKLWSNLAWGFKSDGPANQPTFTATCVIDGVIFDGVANSKKMAKQEACNKIMASLEEGTIAQPKPIAAQGASPAPIKSLKRFNNMFGSPTIKVEMVGTDELPEFHAKATIEGKEFEGIGATSDEATCNFINAVNSALSAKEIEIPLMVRFERRFKEQKIVFEFTGTDENKEYTATFEYADQIFTEKSTVGINDAEEKLARRVLDYVAPSKAKKKAEDDTSPGFKTPLQVLHEKDAALKIEVELIGDPKGAIPFVAKAVVNGHAFQGSGQSKMSAKHNCAAVILAEMYGHHFETIGNFNPPQSEDDVQRGDIGGIDPQSLSTTVQSLIRTKFTDVIATVDSRFNGRKVLAGCVMVKGNDLNTAEVIAVTTGTKCISGANMSHTGKVVNDMHAEVLVRRAMKNYLYKQVELANSSQPSVLVPTARAAGPKYQLAEGVRFHLYISSPPCGDSRIFIASTTKEGEDCPEQNRDRNPARANRGQLRVKIETGMGTIPVKGSELERIQSWEAIMSGERYLNMSCCDKVARWSLLGVQGSLLTNIVVPVYFSSVIVGSMFNQEHIYRGLYGRIKDLPGLAVQPPFIHHCPEIIGTIAPELRNTAKPPVHALIWQAIDGSIEALDTRNGRTFDKKSSSLCKANLFRRYRSLCTDTQTPVNYDDAKASATQYQELKKRLHTTLSARGLGKWVSKPAEQDMFADQGDQVDTASPATPAAVVSNVTPGDAVKSEPAVSQAAEELPESFSNVTPVFTTGTGASTEATLGDSPMRRSGRSNRGKPRQF